MNNTTWCFVHDREVELVYPSDNPDWRPWQAICPLCGPITINVPDETHVVVSSPRLLERLRRTAHERD